MLLATVAGWALQRFAAVPNAALFGFLGGLIVARFVPGAASCPIRPPEPSSDEDRGDEPATRSPRA